MTTLALIRSMSRPVLAAVSLLCAIPLAWAASRRAVAYPDGYRHWTHLSSTFIGPEAPPASMSELGVHHIYANALALEGLRTGHYTDGAKLVYDLLATRTANGVTKTAERLRLDVMEKDSARYRDSGGWGFESFVGGDRNAGRVADRGATMCYSCHAQKTTQGVFSVFRE